MKQLSIYESTEYQADFHQAPQAYSRSGSIRPLTSPSISQERAKGTQSGDVKKEPPGKGASKTRVTEIILSKEMADNVQLVLPMLSHFNQDDRWLAWVNPPLQLLKQWQSQHGDISERIMVLRSNTRSSALDLAKKALSAGTSHAVIVWTDQMTSAQQEELDQASSRGSSHGIVLRYR